MESRSFVQSDEEFELDGSAYMFEPEYTDKELHDMERRQRWHVTEFEHQGVVQPVQPATTAMYPNPGMVAGESSTPCIFSFGFHNWEMHKHEPFPSDILYRVFLDLTLMMRDCQSPADPPLALPAGKSRRFDIRRIWFSFTPPSDYGAIQLS